MPLVRKMGKGFWEVRSLLENRTARVLFTVFGGQMVLLHAFFKKSRKTAQTDLEIAKARESQL
jgi:phage-related protein